MQHLLQYYKYYLLGFVIIISTSIGYSTGSSHIQKKWDLSKAEYNKQALLYQAKIDLLKDKYNEENAELLETVSKNKEEYFKSINSIKSDYDARLSESNRRASVYQQMCNSSSKSSHLANYTTQLDKQLTEGIELVKELRELIKLRDQQLNALGKQLNQLKDTGVIK